MKRKYILAAAALAVLCVGAAAYSINQNTELPSSTPNSSSASSSVASSEPESGSTSVTDNRDIAKAENFVTYQVSKEETTTGTGAGTTEQTMPTEDLSQPEDEEIIQSTMDRFGISREEAEEILNQVNADREEAMKQEAEEKAAEEAKVNAWIAERNQKCLEETGMSFEEFSSMKAKDYYAWTQAHPDVDLSFMQGYEG